MPILDQPEPTLPDTLVLNRHSGVAGAHVITLAALDAPPRPVLGRVVACELPCTVDHGDGHPGCGSADTMTIVRVVLRGLNLPGERIVGLLEHCTRCGSGMIRPVTPTAEEIADGWAPGSVC